MCTHRHTCLKMVLIMNKVGLSQKPDKALLGFRLDRLFPSITPLQVLLHFLCWVLGTLSSPGTCWIVLGYYSACKHRHQPGNVRQPKDAGEKLFCSLVTTSQFIFLKKYNKKRFQCVIIISQIKILRVLCTSQPEYEVTFSLSCCSDLVCHQCGLYHRHTAMSDSSHSFVIFNQYEFPCVVSGLPSD